MNAYAPIPLSSTCTIYFEWLLDIFLDLLVLVHYQFWGGWAFR